MIMKLIVKLNKNNNKIKINKIYNKNLNNVKMLYINQKKLFKVLEIIMLKLINKNLSIEINYYKIQKILSLDFNSMKVIIMKRNKVNL